MQIVLLPVYLLVLIGSEVTMGMGSLVSSVVMVLVIPFALAYITRHLPKTVTGSRNSEQGDNLQLLFLCLAVIVMFASEGKNLLDNPILLAQMFIPLLIFFAVLFFVAQITGNLMKFSKKDTVALNMTTLARNSPLSLTIAVVTFPEKPLIFLALVIGPLIELPVLSVISSILKRWNND